MNTFSERMGRGLKSLIKIRTVLILLFTTWTYAYPQTISRFVITPFGNYYDNNFQNVQSTIGETVIQTVTDSISLILTQGFQQPTPSENTIEDYVVKIDLYPNPFVKIINVTFYVKDVDDFTIRVNNILGTEVYNKEVTNVFSGQVYPIELSRIPHGIYLIHVFSKKEKMARTFKIIKS